MSNAGTCEHCNQSFSYSLIHNGFNESAFAYCDTCGCTAILSAWSNIPEGIVLDYGAIKPAMEAYIAPCICGGRFRSDAVPRCPHCNLTLSAEETSAYIDANAPGTAKGWTWQRSWKGLYAVIFERRAVKDPWNLTRL